MKWWDYVIVVGCAIAGIELSLIIWPLYQGTLAYLRRFATNQECAYHLAAYNANATYREIGTKKRVRP